MYGARARPVVVGEETLKNVENIFSAGKNKVAKTEEGVTPFLRVQHKLGVSTRFNCFFTKRKQKDVSSPFTTRAHNSQSAQQRSLRLLA